MPPSAKQTLLWIIPLPVAPCPACGVNRLIFEKKRFPKTDF